jgi:hypothetical protein
MNRSYRITYRHPLTEVAGVSFLLNEIELTVERARLESQGYIVTGVKRPVGAMPELPLSYQSGSALQ